MKLGGAQEKKTLKFPVCIYCFLGASLETEKFLHNFYLLQIEAHFILWSQMHSVSSTNCRGSSNIL